MTAHFNRKDFIKITGRASCAFLVAGMGSTFLQSCSSIKVFETVAQEGKIKVGLNEFAESNIRIVRAQGMQYDILVSKQEDNSFSAVLMRCSHQDFNLTANMHGLTCGLHGSAFTFTGDITNGPATEPLKKFKVYQENNNLIIY